MATYDTSQVLLARGGPDNLLPHLIIPDHLIAVSGVGSSPTWRTCKTSQVLLEGVSGGFSRGSPVFAPPADWRVPYELKNLLAGVPSRECQVVFLRVLPCSPHLRIGELK